MIRRMEDCLLTSTFGFILKKTKTWFSHDETLAQRGRGFSEIYKDEIGGMQCNILGYVSKMQSKGKEADGTNGLKCLTFKLTSSGFPIIPEGVVKEGIRKVDFEQLMQMYLGQHYSMYVWLCSSRLTHVFRVSVGFKCNSCFLY